ncbi:hypothetical protein HJFPF1_09491 [Paramyrothecium foliicola]|nr:hypothetical protein HJFPF1_09491 [Paramyrothecium foliicola]
MSSILVQARSSQNCKPSSVMVDKAAPRSQDIRNMASPLATTGIARATIRSFVIVSLPRDVLCMSHVTKTEAMVRCQALVVPGPYSEDMVGERYG